MELEFCEGAKRYYYIHTKPIFYLFKQKSLGLHSIKLLLFLFWANMQNWFYVQTNYEHYGCLCVCVYCTCAGLFVLPILFFFYRNFKTSISISQPKVQSVIQHWVCTVQRKRNFFGTSQQFYGAHLFIYILHIIKQIYCFSFNFMVLFIAAIVSELCESEWCCCCFRHTYTHEKKKISSFFSLSFFSQSSFGFWFTFFFHSKCAYWITSDWNGNIKRLTKWTEVKTNEKKKFE